MTAPALGIDIAKLKFNVCLININGKLKHQVFPNTATDLEQLQTWLSKQGVERVHVSLEATGTYGEALSLFLYQAGQGLTEGHTVSRDHLSQTHSRPSPCLLLTTSLCVEHPTPNPLLVSRPAMNAVKRCKTGH